MIADPVRYMSVHSRKQAGLRWTQWDETAPEPTV